MFKNVPNKSYETEDGLIYHSSSVAVVGVVFLRAKGEKQPFVLITKRADTMTDEPGKWCLPCGYLDWNETIEEATIREICEETSLNVLDIKNVMKFPSLLILDNLTSPKQNISIVSAFTAEVAALPFIKTTEETSRVEWVKHTRSALDDKIFAFDHRSVMREVFYDIS